MSKVSDVIDIVKEMSVLELSELVKTFEEEFGVTAAAPAAAAVAAAPAEAEEEKTEFDVVLASFGEKKMDVIRAIKDITGLGLKESKDLVESAPVAIKEAIGKDDAEAIKVRLEGCGASVEVK